MLESEVDEKYYLNHKWHFSTNEDEKHDVNEIAQIEDIKFKAIRSVTDTDKICRCLDTMGGGQREPKVLVKSKAIESIYDPFIVASRGRNPENPSDRPAKIYLEQRLEPNFSGCSNTLTTVQKDNYVAEPLAYDEQNGYIRKDGIVGTLTTNGSSPKHNNRVIEPVRLGYIPYPNSNKAHQSNTFYDENAISPTLDTCTGGNRQVKIQQTNLRIRKLTPKECWRLMGFDDTDFEKTAVTNSNSQLYKQAGNSIVVDVLYYIFREML